MSKGAIRLFSNRWKPKDKEIDFKKASPIETNDKNFVHGYEKPIMNDNENNVR